MVIVDMTELIMLHLPFLSIRMNFAEVFWDAQLLGDRF